MPSRGQFRPLAPLPLDDFQAQAAESVVGIPGNSSFSMRETWNNQSPANSDRQVVFQMSSLPVLMVSCPSGLRKVTDKMNTNGFALESGLTLLKPPMG